MLFKTISKHDLFLLQEIWEMNIAFTCIQENTARVRSQLNQFIDKILTVGTYIENLVFRIVMKFEILTKCKLMWNSRNRYAHSITFDINIQIF